MVSDIPGEQLQEEPQSERGPMGSRDTGSDEPGGGPVNRPEGQVTDTETGVDRQETVTDAPDMPTGDQGG